MYIISARKGNHAIVKGYDYKILCILVALYYKVLGYEVSHD